MLTGGAVNLTLAGRGDNRTVRRGKRRFGKQVTDIDSFERRLKELVSQTGDTDIPDEKIRLALQREATKVGAAYDGRDVVAVEDEPESERT